MCLERRDIRNPSDNFINKLKKEVDKCEVICSNCHRVNHTNVEKFNALKDLIFLYVAEKRTKSSKFDKKKICSMYIDGGLSQSKIAKIVGCSQVHVSRIIRQEVDK